MKKITALFVALFVIMLSHAQSFNGVPISGDLTTAINRFKAKGYTFIKFTKSGATMSGNIGVQKVELYINTTVTSKQVRSMIIYFRERDKWSELKADYDNYLSVLTEKYGTPTHDIIRFEKPYYDGDGYEMTAVAVGKVMCMSLWMDIQNMNIMIDVTKYKQVSITYENKKLCDLDAAEKDKINKVSL